jgi:hypothetical protein
MLALVLVVAALVFVFVHTDYGRETLREQVEAQLDTLFTGGGRIGKLEGSPFGDLVIRDVVINGPDGKPAITADVVRAHIRLADLVKKDVRLDRIVADKVHVALERDENGKLEIARLLAPQPEPKEKLRWNIDLSSIQLRDAHVMIDSGQPDIGIVNLDGIDITANALIPVNGLRAASVNLTGTWRERDAKIAIATSVRDDGEVITIRALEANVGNITVAGTGLAIQRRANAMPRIWGAMQIVAKRADVAALVPHIELPADIALGIRASAKSTQSFAIAGTVGTTPIEIECDADLDAKRVTGKLSTGDFDLASLTKGKIVARVGVTGDFDVALAENGALPTAAVRLAGRGTYGELPRSAFTLNATTRGEHISAALDVEGATKVAARAELAKVARRITLERGTLKASTTDPQRASGGKAPLHGALAVDLTARGQLAPVVAVDVEGTVRGQRLRMNDLSVATLDLQIDAAQLPRTPRGRMRLRMTDIVRGDMQLGALTLDARNRADGKIQVDLSSHPKPSPWVIELAALVTPPDRGDAPVIVDVQRHRVRAGNGVDWTGTGGRLVIGANAFELTGLSSQSADGRIAIAGAFTPARRNQRASLTVRAEASGPTFGAANLAIAVDAPAELANVREWKQRGRAAIRSAQLRLQNIDLAAVRGLAASTSDLAGRVDGTIDIDATSATGSIRVRGVKSKALRGIESIDADLALAQPKDDELEPTLTARAAGVGTATAKARVALPERLFDPDAWRQLGVNALRGASVRTDTVNVDPAMLARFGITSTMRGRARFELDVGDGLSTVRLAAIADDVRGTPIAEPVSLRVNAAIDDKQTTASIAMTSQGKPVTLLAFEGRVPISVASLQATPAELAKLPIEGKLVVPKTSAPQLLNVFGRTEIVGGMLDGKVTVAGTIGNPTLVAHLVGENLAVPPRNNRRLQTLERIALDATWDGRRAKLTIDGVEDRGGKLSLVAEGSPSQLASATARIKATSFDTSPLLAFAPGAAAGIEGSLDANLSIRGFDPRIAKIIGEIHLRNARVPLAPTIGTLRRARVDIAIRDRDIVVGASGKLGAGDAKVEGTIALDGVSLTGGRAKVMLRKVSPIGAVEPIIDADITATIARKGTVWNADVVVDRGFVKVTKTDGEKLKPASIPADLTIGAPKPARASDSAPMKPPAKPAIVANITVRPTKVESKEVHTTVRGKLVVTADADSLGVVGTLAAASGDIDLFDRRYRIERAAVTFDGTIDPRLDVRITHDFPEVTTITVVRDRLSKPELELSSNPAIYTKTQLLGFLLGGEPSGDPSSGSARDKATSAGTSLVANAIGGYVRSALPFDIDVLRYEAATVGSSAAITVGTWLTHALFFAFRQRLDARPDENTGEGTIEYWLNQQLKVQGTAGDRGYDGVDVLWRKRF